MQASKIQVGSVYAIKRGGEPTMFRVTKITTVKASNGTSSTIFGDIIEEPLEHDRAVDVVQVLGPYEEFSALVEKKREKERLQREEQERKRDRTVKIFKAFCKLVGVEPPKKDKHDRYGDYTDPFYLGYQNTIEISQNAGMDALAKFLKVEGEQ